MTRFLSLKILFFITSFALSNNAFAAEACVENQNSSFIKELVEYSMLSRKGCEGLKKIWENRSELLNKTTDKILKDSQKFNREFIQCNEALYHYCYKDSKAIDESELNKMFLDFKKDPLLNMKEPSAMCTQRAIVLSEKLASQGFDVEIAHFESPTIVGIYRNQDLKYEQYSPADKERLGFHYATSIMVKLADGKIEKRILDPQFADRPMSLDEYSRLITGATCVDKRKRSTECLVQFKSPVSHNYMEPKDYIQFLDGTLTVSNSCGWNLLRGSINEITKFNNEIAQKNKDYVIEDSSNQTILELSRNLNLKNLRNRIQFEEGKIEAYLRAVQNIQNSRERASAEAKIKRSRETIRDLHEEIKVRNY